MLKGLVVNEVMSPYPERLPIKSGESIKFDYKIREDLKLDPKDTYMLIFSPNTFNALECFKEQFNGKILFESKKAINTMHPTGARNTLVIFEVDDEAKEKV